MSKLYACDVFSFDLLRSVALIFWTWSHGCQHCGDEFFIKIIENLKKEILVPRQISKNSMVAESEYFIISVYDEVLKSLFTLLHENYLKYPSTRLLKILQVFIELFQVLSKDKKQVDLIETILESNTFQLKAYSKEDPLWIKFLFDLKTFISLQFHQIHFQLRAI